MPHLCGVHSIHTTALEGLQQVAEKSDGSGSNFFTSPAT